MALNAGMNRLASVLTGTTPRFAWVPAASRGQAASHDSDAHVHTSGPPRHAAGAACSLRPPLAAASAKAEPRPATGVPLPQAPAARPAAAAFADHCVLAHRTTRDSRDALAATTRRRRSTACDARTAILAVSAAACRAGHRRSCRLRSGRQGVRPATCGRNESNRRANRPRPVGVRPAP